MAAAKCVWIVAVPPVAVDAMIQRMSLLDTFVIVQKGSKINWPALPFAIFGLIVLLSCVIPLIIMHIWCWLYLNVYFRLLNIPRPKLKDYLSFDRARLEKLNWIQRFACEYCSYGNGVTAWCKATANMTELYSCAIKHSIQLKGHEHQKDFYEYEEFH